MDEIEQAIRQIKAHYPEVIVFVDNCYGEFVEEREPIEAGADLIAGLIKTQEAVLRESADILPADWI